MKRKITISENKFNKLFNKLNESAYSSIPMIDNNVMAVSERFEKYAKEINTFVEKFNSFHQVLSEISNKLGLALENYEDSSHYFFNNPDDGIRIVYSFVFPDFPKHNTPEYDGINDETAEMWYNKYEEAKNVLDNELNTSFFEDICRIRIENLEESVDVEIEFSLWE